MALKGDRVEHLTDISFFKSDAVIERGLIVAHLTGGSGAAMDDALAQVDTVSTTGDLAAGLVLTDAVNIDLTRQQYNAHGVRDDHGFQRYKQQQSYGYSGPQNVNPEEVFKKMFEECLAKSLQEIKEYGAGVETLKTPVIWDRSAKCKALEQAKVKEQERATSLLLRHSRSLNSTQRESPGADDKTKRKKASSEDQTKVSIHVCPC